MIAHIRRIEVAIQQREKRVAQQREHIRTCASLSLLVAAQEILAVMEARLEMDRRHLAEIHELLVSSRTMLSA
jgi:hypothetical protein